MSADILLKRLRAVSDGGVDFDCEISAHTRSEIIEAEEACGLAADEIKKLQRELHELRSLINTPHTADFTQAVQLEAAHQRERWGIDHDAGKEDSDWFWLLGYLSGKAIRPDCTPEKQLHHIITTAAACLNWHAARAGIDTRMRPGIAPPEDTQ